MARVEEEIIALSRRIVEIELSRDADSLEHLICDDYIGVDPSGALINKEISVGRYRDPTFILTQHGISDIEVKVFGDAALEIGLMRLKGRLGSFEFGGTYRYSHIWKKDVEGWRVKASQLTPILRDERA